MERKHKEDRKIYNFNIDDGRGGGGVEGLQPPPLTFYCERAEPRHFCRMMNNFLLFDHGQLIIIKTILESLSKRRVLCLKPNNVRSRLD